MQISFCTLLISLLGAQHGHHGGNYHPDSQTHIDTEIQNLDAHFGKHQCLDLLMVDCQHHVTNGDEMVCGSDGVTYPNHCKFVHAVCMYTDLTAAHTGQCTSTTMAMTTVGNAAGSTMPGSVATGGSGTTGTTPPPTTTLSPEQIAFQNVFCHNKDSINCPAVVTPLCGSDGVIYNSSCHVSKARCDNPNLQTVDGSKCGLTTPVSVAPVVG